MNIYHVSQDDNDDYDTFSDFVCAAKNQEAAALTHPRGLVWIDGYWRDSLHETSWSDHTWTNPANVTVVIIGKAAQGTKAGVICASFHAD